MRARVHEETRFRAVPTPVREIENQIETRRSNRRSTSHEAVEAVETTSRPPHAWPK